MVVLLLTLRMVVIALLLLEWQCTMQTEQLEAGFGFDRRWSSRLGKYYEERI